MKKPVAEPQNKRDLAFWIATWGGAGLIRPASGTWGSLAALPFAYIIYASFGALWVGVSAIILFITGQWAATRYAQRTAQDDASEIVIDEVVGQFIALLPFFIIGRSDWISFASAFAAFRFFDILKPWPVSLADQRHDGWGVMLDDVLAGLYAALTGVGILYLAF